MENFTITNNSVFLEEKIQDYVSENHHEEELRLKKELRKRKLAMISLGSVYVMLILASFTLLT